MTVDGHQAALIQVESKKMSCPAPRLKLTPIGRGEREIRMVKIYLLTASNPLKKNVSFTDIFR